MPVWSRLVPFEVGEGFGEGWGEGPEQITGGMLIVMQECRKLLGGELHGLRHVFVRLVLIPFGHLHQGGVAGGFGQVNLAEAIDQLILRFNVLIALVNDGFGSVAILIRISSGHVRNGFAGLDLLNPIDNVG